jgi:hypothetical protein
LRAARSQTLYAISRSTARFWYLRKTVFCCERHVLCATPVNVLFFSLLYVKSYNPEASGYHSPFSRMGRKKILVQDTLYAPGRHTDPGTLDALCDRPFLGTHRCLELAYPLAFGEQLFPGRERRGTFRPLPSRPSGPVFRLKRRYLTFLRLRIGSGTLLSQVPPRADITCGLPRMPPVSRTHEQRGEMQLAVPSRARLLGTHCVRAAARRAHGPDICCHSYEQRTGNGMSRASS